jgi:hypothetical protein
MGRELAKLGNSVQVFGNCKDREGSWDGVEYVHWERPWAAPERTDHDVLLVSRQTSPLSHFTNVKAKILWMHDVHVGESAGGDLERRPRLGVEQLAPGPARFDLSRVSE